jgi:hypothetical protein
LMGVTSKRGPGGRPAEGSGLPSPVVFGDQRRKRLGATAD